MPSATGCRRSCTASTARTRGDRRHRGGRRPGRPRGGARPAPGRLRRVRARGPRPARAAGSSRPRSPTAGSCSSAASSWATSTRPTSSSPAELGLSLRPSYVADPGEITFDLVDGLWCGDDIPWMTDADRADGARVIGPLRRALALGRRRRPLEPSRRRAARPALAERLAARGGRRPGGDPGARGRGAERGRRVGRARLDALGAAHGRGGRLAGRLRPVRVGEP